MTPEATGPQRSLIYWSPEVEVGTPGHFDFWCQNPHPEPVGVRMYSSSCNCAGIDLAPVPQEAFRDYAVTSALAGGPLGTAAGPLAAYAHIALERKLTWSSVLDNLTGEKSDQTIPAAPAGAGTQMAILRLGWKPKDDPGQKALEVGIAATLGDDPARLYTFRALTYAVPAFELVHRKGPDGWGGVSEVPAGELRENGEVKRTIYLMSTTRRQMVFTVAIDRPDPCITWTEPVPASEDELVSLNAHFNRPDMAPRRAKCLYRMDVTVRERVEVAAGSAKQIHQLDLGLLDRFLRVSAVKSGTMTIPIRGRVLGDVTFVSGASDGKLDLGNSIPSGQDRTADVVLVAERPGLDLKLVAEETTPNFLKVKLEPADKIEGRTQWRLRVTVPKGSLYGALPFNSAIVLITNDPVPRRLRIPVRGQTYDSGGPRI